MIATYLLGFLVTALAVTGLAAGLLLGGRPLRKGCARGGSACPRCPTRDREVAP